MNYHWAQVKFYHLSHGQDGSGHTVFDHLNNHSDMIDLNERAGGKLDSVTDSIMATPGMRGLWDFFLKSFHEDDKPAGVPNYGNPTLAKCQPIHSHTYKANLTVSMILSLDRSIYGKIVEELYYSYYMGTEQ